MAYTQSDLDSVQSAIVALAAGTRKTRVTVGGNTVEYGQADLPQLRALRAEIQAEINSAAGRRQYFRIKTDKGL